MSLHSINGMLGVPTPHKNTEALGQITAQLAFLLGQTEYTQATSLCISGIASGYTHYQIQIDRTHNKGEPLHIFVESSDQDIADYLNFWCSIFPITRIRKQLRLDNL